MHKNLKQFMIKVLMVIGLVVLTRAIFKFPIEFFNLRIFDENLINRVFSKIDLVKVITFITVFFGFFFKDRIARIPHRRFNWIEFVKYFSVTEFMVVLYYVIRAMTNAYLIDGILVYFVWFVIVVILGMSFFSATIAVFGKMYVYKFINNFRKELIISTIASVILYNLLIIFQNMWLLFSENVAYVLFRLTAPFYDVIYYMGPIAPILEINDFAVAIGAPCSGIDSMLLFFAFSTALFALDFHRIKKASYAIFFIVGFAGVLVVNILRLYLLILVGVNISERFAVGLFHTNAGWIFFVLYFLGYYLFIRRFIYKKNATARTIRPRKKQ